MSKQVSSETDPLLAASQSIGRSSYMKVADSDPLDSSSGGGGGAYVKTYTAGEDGSRLAAAAKELGLEEYRRKTRPPVRKFGAPPDLQSTMAVIAFADKKKHDIGETLAGVAGNVLEWYDFAVFGYFGDVIGHVFFPPQAGNTATMESFAVFGGAFLMRPVGGLLLGYLGDVYGRRQALTTSIFLMAFPTFAMGCLPPFDVAGWISPVLLIFIRLLQGMSVGGQLMSSLVFTLENVPREQWGLYGSFVWATGNLGVLLGGLVGYFIRSSCTPEQLISFGWRIPFLSGVIVSFAGFYLRSSGGGDEHEEGESSTVNSNEEESLRTSEDGSKTKRETTKNPILLVFEVQNLRPLCAAAMVPMLWSAGFYLSFVWMAIYMATLCEHPVPGAFAINSVALFLGVVLLFPIAGMLADRYGFRNIMSIGGVSIAVLSPWLIRSIGLGIPWLSFCSQLFLGICLSFWGSPMGAWLVDSFDPEARLTSVAVGYNTAHAIVGGFTPALATYLVDAVGPTSPGWIYVIIACVAMTGLWLVAPPRIALPQVDQK